MEVASIMGEDTEEQHTVQLRFVSPHSYDIVMAIGSWV